MSLKQIKSDSIYGIIYKKKYFEQFGVILVFFFKNEADDAVKKKHETIYKGHFAA